MEIFDYSGDFLPPRPLGPFQLSDIDLDILNQAARGIEDVPDILREQIEKFTLNTEKFIQKVADSNSITYYYHMINHLMYQISKISGLGKDFYDHFHSFIDNILEPKFDFDYDYEKIEEQTLGIKLAVLKYTISKKEDGYTYFQAFLPLVNGNITDCLSPELNNKDVAEIIYKTEEEIERTNQISENKKEIVDKHQTLLYKIKRDINQERLRNILYCNAYSVNSSLYYAGDILLKNFNEDIIDSNKIIMAVLENDENIANAISESIFQIFMSVLLDNNERVLNKLLKIPVEKYIEDKELRNQAFYIILMNLVYKNMKYDLRHISNMLNEKNIFIDMKLVYYYLAFISSYGHTYLDSFRRELENNLQEFLQGVEQFEDIEKIKDDWRKLSYASILSYMFLTQDVHELYLPVFLYPILQSVNIYIAYTLVDLIDDRLSSGKIRRQSTLEEVIVEISNELGNRCLDTISQIIYNYLAPFLYQIDITQLANYSLRFPKNYRVEKTNDLFLLPGNDTLVQSYKQIISNANSVQTYGIDFISCEDMADFIENRKMIKPRLKEFLEILKAEINKLGFSAYVDKLFEYYKSNLKREFDKSFLSKVFIAIIRNLFENGIFHYIYYGLSKIMPILSSYIRDINEIIPDLIVLLPPDEQIESEISPLRKQIDEGFDIVVYIMAKYIDIAAGTYTAVLYFDMHPNTKSAQALFYLLTMLLDFDDIQAIIKLLSTILSRYIAKVYGPYTTAVDYAHTSFFLAFQFWQQGYLPVLIQYSDIISDILRDVPDEQKNEVSKLAAIYILLSILYESIDSNENI